jgi:hypothetical protein
MKFTNVPEPPGFAGAVKAAVENVVNAVESGKKPKFPNKWSDFKPDMTPATFGKCGYCEVDVHAVDRFKGDVEHYRPKGRLDRMSIGDDATVSSSKLFDAGYHWLAYSWDNYILSCSPCNSAHKGNRFPIEPEPTSAPKKGDENNEKPLLLHPFGRKDPTKHLMFDDLGVVGPRKSSKYGRHTIAVCGLQRSPLEKKRRQLAGVVKRQIDVLEDAASSSDALDLALQNLADFGGKDREHAGMVRSMFQAATSLDWGFIEQAAPRPEPVFQAQR